MNEILFGNFKNLMSGGNTNVQIKFMACHKLLCQFQEHVNDKVYSNVKGFSPKGILDHLKSLVAQQHFIFNLESMLSDVIEISAQPDLETISLNLSIQCVCDIIKMQTLNESRAKSILTMLMEERPDGKLFLKNPHFQLITDMALTYIH